MCEVPGTEPHSVNSPSCHQHSLYQQMVLGHRPESPASVSCRVRVILPPQAGPRLRLCPRLGCLARAHSLTLRQGSGPLLLPLACGQLSHLCPRSVRTSPKEADFSAHYVLGAFVAFAALPTIYPHQLLSLLELTPDRRGCPAFWQCGSVLALNGSRQRVGFKSHWPLSRVLSLSVPHFPHM